MKARGIVLAVLTLAAYLAFRGVQAKNFLRVECLDVGAGQCWLVHGPRGTHTVINCASDTPGADGGAPKQAVRALTRQGVNAVDLVLVMRADASGARGAVELARQFPVLLIVSPADAPADAPNGVRHRWRRLRPGSSIRLLGGLEMQTAGISQVDVVHIPWGRAGVALVDRLSPEPTRITAAALVLGSRAARSPAEALKGMQAECAVVHSGRKRGEWADFGLVRALQDECAHVWRTSQSGGVVIESDRERLRVSVTRDRGLP